MKCKNSKEKYNTGNEHKYLARLKRIEGQVRGLIRMVEEDRYCIDIITQTSAVRRALSAFEDELLKDHLASCALEQIKKGKSKKVIEEIMTVFKLKGRK